MRDKTTHLSMQHCFHVVFYMIGTQYLHIKVEKISPSELVSNGSIFQIIIKCNAHAQNSKSLFIYIYVVSGSMLFK